MAIFVLKDFQADTRRGVEEDAYLSIQNYVQESKRYISTFLLAVFRHL